MEEAGAQVLQCESPAPCPACLLLTLMLELQPYTRLLLLLYCDVALLLQKGSPCASEGGVKFFLAWELPTIFVCQNTWSMTRFQGT